MREVYEKKKCRLCDNKKLIKSIDLGLSPLANQFLKEKKKLPKYPLKVLRCNKCHHLQLSHVVDKKKLFSNYLFVSGTSPTNLFHFKKYAQECSKKFLNKKSKILDIASNDGSFLKFFSKKNLRVGIDPAKNIQQNLKNEFITETNFFNFKQSSKLKKKYGNFDLITANNVCAHVDELLDFIKGVKNLLKKKGVFIFEVGYFDDVYKNKTFDTIYHEHLDYHLLTPLINFFQSLNMEVFDVKKIFIQGGSLRIYVCNKGEKKINKKKINSIVFKEKKSKYSKKLTYIKFQKYIDKIKYDLIKEIKSIKKTKQTIIGYGASAKSTTLLNYFGINIRHLNFLVDLSIYKQGRYSPGSDLKIYSTKAIEKLKPNYILILAWNFSTEIINQNINYLKMGGKFITPFPKINIIDYKNHKKFLKK